MRTFGIRFNLAAFVAFIALTNECFVLALVLGFALQDRHAMLREFREFLFKGEALDVAIGLIIGTAFAKLVSAIVEDLVMPLIGLLSPHTDWRHWAFHVGASSIRIGHLLGTLIDFTIVGVVLFVLVRRLLHRLS